MRMLDLDRLEAARAEAAAHARLVEGLAVAARARPEALARYVADWRAARWLEPAAATAAARPVDPLQALAQSPWFAELVAEATRTANQFAAAPPTPPPADSPAVRAIVARRRG